MGAIGQISPQDKWLYQQPVSNQDYKLTGNWGWNVGGVQGTGGTTGTYGIERHTPHGFQVDGISYANSLGAVGCSEVAVSPFAGAGQTGRQEQSGFTPNLKHVYG